MLRRRRCVRLGRGESDSSVYTSVDSFAPERALGRAQAVVVLVESPDRRARAARIRAQRRLHAQHRRVQIDVDEFAREAAAGLSAIGSGRDEDGIKHLEAAMELNRGDFLVEERYDWAIIERERLLDLASRVLRALAAKEPASDTATHYRLMREFGER